MPRKRASRAQPDVREGAIAAEELAAPFPEIEMPIQPPFPPMEAKSVKELPAEKGWLFEPKWDGFRGLVFRSGDEVIIQSKAGQPMGRYFPEVIENLGKLAAGQFVLDGEIVILSEGKLDFDALLQRIHPAESRVRKLAKETPAMLLVFDLLVDERGQALLNIPLYRRRERLEAFLREQGGANKLAGVRLSPSTPYRATAERWMREFGGMGCDGIVAKLADAQYLSGSRDGMRKIKRLRTCDCVLGGFRYSSKGDALGSLLLGLYDDDGLLQHVGFTSSFSNEQRKELLKILKPHMGGEGFTGRAPGGPSRWSTERSGEWERLDAKLVCEVQYDHFSGHRFRHGTRFLRWRPEKKPKQCTFEQLEVAAPPDALAQLGLTS